MAADHMPWNILRSWSPFKLDALGLVTLLGAEEVNKAVGSLQRRRITEFLPFLAAHIVAGDRIRDEQAGFAIYNVTDGICTTELKGWFTRWLSSQEIRGATTTFRWYFAPRKSGLTFDIPFIAMMLSVLAVGPLLALTIVMGDWYGLAGTISIIISVVVRRVVLWQLRTGLNAVADPAKVPKDLPFSRQDVNKHRQGSDAKDIEFEGTPTGHVTLFITRSDGKMVTMSVPRTILATFVRQAEIPRPHLYHAVRWLCWLAFAVLLVSLGMSSLLTQIYIVILLVVCTWATCHDFDFELGRKRKTQRHQPTGEEEEKIVTPLTSRISVEQQNPPAKSTTKQNLDKRMYAYIWANLDEKQEDMLRHWSMLPFRGVEWYQDYDKAKKDSKLASQQPVFSPATSAPSRQSISSTKSRSSTAPMLSEKK
ncbi:hypothetical protein CKM354_000972400 [Cercospora kikuchii]|uniref:Uncharacterized protein n=1 Tax=Cercospora kikuchii TaxID=84275 RepID=A0A9P3FK68_9PEZI|nr:uncharacterized protein CKM354_000972400 [Cercospora kikuchii]GIZ46604.1 hypothetical protein CKM354_000972400 [Cercospora kikuchii]